MSGLFRNVIRAVVSFLPAEAPQWIYTRLLSTWPLRGAINALLRFLIPEFLTIPEGILILNPDDPVVSGAIALGVYERGALERWRSLIHDGMTVLDIGSNIGLYTLVAARLNPSGRVIAFEPSSENASIMEAMVLKNKLPNVTLIRSAAGDTSSRAMLYLERHNKGLHSLIPSHTAFGTEDVSVRPVDEIVREENVQRVDLVKVDVEGFEAKVFAGMKRILEEHHPRIIFEFMPRWIQLAGDNPLTLLQSLQNMGYRLIILGDEKINDEEVGDFSRFLMRFKRKDDYVNLLAMPSNDNSSL